MKKPSKQKAIKLKSEEGKQKTAKIQRKRNKKTRKQKQPTVTIEQEQKSVLLESVSELEEDALVPALEGYDEESLARAKSHWFFGEWNTLANLDLKTIEHHPERNRFALMAASAHQQLGHDEKARKYSQIALEWGCPPRIVAQILVAGVHNSLGRAAALKQDDSRIAYHFKAAVDVTDNRDTALVSHARSVREMARMGLLPQAMMSLGNLAEESVSSEHRHAHFDAHAKVLTMEVDWLRDKVVGELKSKYGTILKERQEISRADKHASKQQKHDGNRYYGFHELDKKLEAYLNYDEGYFVELGANDGISHSNTYYFEQVRELK